MARRFKSGLMLRLPRATALVLLALQASACDRRVPPGADLPPHVDVAADLRMWAPAWEKELDREGWRFLASSWSGHAYFASDRQYMIVDLTTGVASTGPGRSPAKASAQEFDPRSALVFVDHDRGRAPRIVSVDARDGGIQGEHSLATDGAFSECTLENGGEHSIAAVGPDVLVVRRCLSATDRLSNAWANQRNRSGKNEGTVTIERRRGRDGALVWSVPLQGFGPSAEVLVRDGVIVLYWHDLRALDAATGTTLWRQGDLESGVAPRVTLVPGMVVNATLDRLRRYDLRSGAELAPIARGGEHNTVRVTASLAFVPFADKTWHAVELATGRERWTASRHQLGPAVHWSNEAFAIVGPESTWSREHGFQVLDLVSGEQLFRSAESLTVLAVVPTSAGLVVITQDMSDQRTQVAGFRPAAAPTSP